ncbi:GPT [Acanthosepion pharaonis]|uniref:alanine transaminase n=1 Tax=Acanthosepion pharaonis TaxID=158019 RepID=A0A812EY65_ACAPH|nr:GPT [Sepia pharaonis]
MIAAGMEISLTHILPLLPGCHGDGTHAILVPGPTYPTINDSIEVAGFRTVTYFLNEKDDNWNLDIADLSEALEKSPHPVMSIFVQNPGYPTGHIHGINELQTIIRFAKKNRLIIFAIENFQLDIYDPEEKPFVSMRKVLLEMGSEFESVQLLSFFSPNKSIIGEPGMSVTYIDTFRLDEEVFEKLVDLTLSPPVIQQIYVSLLLSPVAFLEYPSFKEFHNEKENIINRIARIAKLVTSFFNSQPYITCTKPHAGQTIFPKLEFPQSWTYIGPRSSASLEEFYCQQLRDATQVRIIAGMFFSEFPGSSHFKFSFPLD